MRRAASDEACSTRARTSASCVTSDSNSSADDSPAPSTNMTYASTIAAMTSRPSPRRTGPCSMPGHRRVDGDQQVGAVLVDHREVEVELGREVAVQDRLADLGALGDVVHGDVVEALGGEELLGDAQHLGAAFVASHPRAARPRGRVVCPVRHPAMVATGCVKDATMIG